ncbi:MAG: Ig-like domain repeat protein [Capsulimonadaceae bacterium]
MSTLTSFLNYSAICLRHCAAPSTARKSAMLLLVVLSGCCFTMMQPAAAQGTFMPATTLAPAGLDTPVLLTDGTVMIHVASDTNSWVTLIPDSSGNYVDGTWSVSSNNIAARSDYPSAILPDGRYWICGGANQAFTSDYSAAEIFDPTTGIWSSAPDSPNPYTGNSGMAQLANGQLLVGDESVPNTAIYDPVMNTWTQTGSLIGSVNAGGEGWQLLPDGTVLNAFQTAQRYLPTTGVWAADASLPEPLVDLSNYVGPVAQLYNGQTFCIGAPGNTLIYTSPSTVTGMGSFAVGPQVPDDNVTDNTPACVEPDGDVLMIGTAVVNGPATFFEYDPLTSAISTVPFAAEESNGSQLRMLALPNGQVMVTDGSSQAYFYTPSGSPQSSWQPTVTGVAANTDGSYTLTGTQLNGFTYGGSYGADADTNTNYPIVALTDSSGNVTYCRTYNFSTMGLSTGSTSETTQFTLPNGLSAGSYNLTVIANGISSAPFSFSFGFNVALTAAYNGTSQLNLTLSTITSSAGAASPTGTATFYYGTTPLGTAGLQSGSADFAFNPAGVIPVGNDVIKAVYSGDSNYPSATVSQVVPVTGLPVSITAGYSPTTPSVLQSDVVSVTVTGSSGAPAPTGMVQFSEPTTGISLLAPLLAQTSTTSVATFNTPFDAAGTLSPVIQYDGDTIYAPATFTSSVTVGAITPTLLLTSTANPAQTEQTVLLYVQLTGGLLPTGTVSITDGGQPLAVITLDPNNEGNDFAAVTFTDTGTHDLMATYSGDSNFGSATATLMETVTSTEPSVPFFTDSFNPTTAVVDGQETVSVNLTATASTPTGTVTLYQNAQQVGLITLNNGTGNTTLSFATPGQQVIDFVYSGDSVNSAMCALDSINAGLGTPTVALGVPTGTVTVGQSAAFTVLVNGPAGAASGLLSVTDAGNEVAVVPVQAGSGAFETTFSTSGTHTLTGQFLGDPTKYGGASATAVVNVTPSTTTGTIDGTVSDESTGLPLVASVGALGSAGSGSTTSASGTGAYSLSLPPGTYTLTGSAAGYITDTVMGVVVSVGGTITENLPLIPLPVVTATPNPVTGTTTTLSVTAPAAYGNNPTFSWSQTDGPPGATIAAPTASTTNVTFASAGQYTFSVTINGSGAQTVTVSGSVTVVQTPTTLVVTPGPTYTMALNATKLFNAGVFDQFGEVVASVPPITWSVTGVGSITTGGDYSSGPTAGMATVEASTGTISGSTLVTVGTGVSASVHVLWDNTGGAVSLWSYDPASGSFTQNGYGPYGGWSVNSIADGPDGLTRVLWTSTGGAASLWSDDTTSGAYTQNTFGPYPGWSAAAVSVAPDNTTHVLWRSTGGAAAIWNEDNSTGAFTQNTYGPYAGWTLSAMADGLDGMTRVLWTQSSGTAAIWLLDNTTGAFTQNTFGPYPGWTATALSVGADNTTHVLWTSTSGAVSVWLLNASTGAFTQDSFGPFPGWTASGMSDDASDSTDILWTSTSGASLWSLEGSADTFTQNSFGPYPAWSASAICAFP